MLKKIPTPILITGAKGFIGSNLLRRLICKGYETNIIVRTKDNCWRIEDILNKTNIFFEDLTNFKLINKIINKLKPKTIFHLAAYGAYEYQNEIEKIKKVNLDATINLINTCTEQGFNTFINTGSNSEYGLKKNPMKETDVLTPNSYYAVFKAASTLFCQYESISKKLPIISIRPFHVYGPYEEKTRLIPNLISSILFNRCPPLSNPENVRDMVYIEDAVNFYLSLTNENVDYGSIFNLGTGTQHSLKEIVDTTLALTESKIKITWNSMPSRKWDQIIWQADMSNTNKILGWTPENSLKTGLSKTIEWHKHYYQN